MGCPGADSLAQFVEGALSVAEIERLEEHLDTCPGCARLVEELLQHSTPSEPAELVEPGGARGLQRGAAVGRYVILDLRGAGGMGEVYCAYDPELDRKIALKLVRSDVFSRAEGKQAAARFIREAKAMARLRHPNVVTVYDVGTVDGRVFIAMELIEGTTLRGWLTGSPRSWREIRDTFLLAGQGLAAAHSAGIVHRDFKPDNVLVGRDASVCVSDFGLARAAAEPGAPDCAPSTSGATVSSKVTSMGVVQGTPRYMAPEQRRGDAVGARADQ
ncbi:MAG: protein kinase, partial [Deltaproteobacteria bacterium]|nr:protein kinase [Deltaproteobacteria bacterium]